MPKINSYGGKKVEVSQDFTARFLGFEHLEISHTDFHRKDFAIFLTDG